jgi:hypothetical protein
MRWWAALLFASCGSSLTDVGVVTPDNPCGAKRHQCSDGYCCFEGWDCTVDRPYMPDPPGKGYCEDALGKKRASARKP